MARLFILCLFFFCFPLFPSDVQCQTVDTIPALIEDGDFDQPCLPESRYKPYSFEQSGHTNTPDILFLKKEEQGERWHWKEFGCLAERLVLPYIPLHYACTRPGKEPLVPPGISGDRYVGLIKEPESTEALVYPLKVPLMPGVAFRLRFAARAMSDSCLYPRILVVGSKTEPCLRVVNQLHPSGASTNCPDGSIFQAQHILLSDPLPNHWELINHVFIATDTIQWLVFAVGNMELGNTNPYLGIDDIVLEWLELEVDMQIQNYKSGVGGINEWLITITNPSEREIPQVTSLLQLDQMIDSIECAYCKDPLPSGLIPMVVDLPPAKNGKPGIFKTRIWMRSQTDCPLDNVLYFPGYPEYKAIRIRSPEAEGKVFIPSTIDSLSKAVLAGILPLDSIVGGDIYFQGDIVWDLPAYLFRDCQLLIGWGNRVTVSKNADILLEGTKLSGCGRPWETLRVNKDGKLHIRGGQVREAETAIKVQAGGVLILQQTGFEGLETEVETEHFQPEKQRGKRQKE
jgi:hypothetical protein